MKKLNRPLVQMLDQFVAKQPFSFHVPGHKHGLLSTLPSALKTALTYDLTELSELDDLHAATGVIQEAEHLLTNFYQTDRSFFLVNGSTVGNLAMIYATCQPGDVVIVQRNAHQSIFHALELVNVKPIFITPEWDVKTKTAGTVSARTVRAAFGQYPQAKAVILTYPTYYGVTGTELKQIIDMCHSKSVPVLVDEAHGAHLKVTSSFPPSALTLGADIVVHSAHKTLPAMTMGSFLHVQSTFIDVERVADYLRMLQSSSPSYVLMASLDDARAYVETYTEEDAQFFFQRRCNWIDELRRIEQVELIETDDPLKLIMRVSGYTGFSVQRFLEQYKIYTELADVYQVLMILPLEKKERSFSYESSLPLFQAAVKALCQTPRESLPEETLPLEGVACLTMSLQQVRKAPTEWISIAQAEGRIAAKSVVPYPPGVPLCIGGERITSEHVNKLMHLIRLGAHFQGAIEIGEQKIQVVIEEKVEAYYVE